LRIRLPVERLNLKSSILIIATGIPNFSPCSFTGLYFEIFSRSSTIMLNTLLRIPVSISSSVRVDSVSDKTSPPMSAVM
jgi:hypothetical protein